MFSQEAARQTEISPHVYQGELPVIRPSPHDQSNFGQDLWNWWPFGAGRYCAYWSRAFLTCQRHALVSKIHSKLSPTDKRREGSIFRFGEGKGVQNLPIIGLCEHVELQYFIGQLIKIYLPYKKLLKWCKQCRWITKTEGFIKWYWG